MFTNGPDRPLSRFALGLNRQELKALVGLLTGHTTLNRHLTIIRYAQHVEKRKKPHSTFWENVLQKCWTECPFLDHTYWSSISYVRLNLYPLHGL